MHYCFTLFYDFILYNVLMSDKSCYENRIYDEGLLNKDLIYFVFLYVTGAGVLSSGGSVGGR